MIIKTETVLKTGLKCLTRIELTIQTISKVALLHDTKECGATEVQLHPLLTSAQNELL